MSPCPHQREFLFLPFWVNVLFLFFHWFFAFQENNFKFDLTYAFLYIRLGWWTERTYTYIAIGSSILLHAYFVCLLVLFCFLIIKRHPMFKIVKLRLLVGVWSYWMRCFHVGSLWSYVGQFWYCAIVYLFLTHISLPLLCRIYGLS